MRVTPEIGDGLDSLAREAREATTAADKAQREAAARSREIARRLREAGSAASGYELSGPGWT